MGTTGCGVIAVVIVVAGETSRAVAWSRRPLRRGMGGGDFRGRVRAAAAALFPCDRRALRQYYNTMIYFRFVFKIFAMTVAGALSRIPLRSMYTYEVFEKKRKNHIAQSIKTLYNIVAPYTQAIPETGCRVRPVSRSAELTKIASG